jgi:hypothetical protein
MSTYVSNVDKFKVMTINEFSEWKKNEDTALQTNLSEKVGYNTMRNNDGKRRRYTICL